MEIFLIVSYGDDMTFGHIMVFFSVGANALGEGEVVALYLGLG